MTVQINGITIHTNQSLTTDYNAAKMCMIGVAQVAQLTLKSLEYQINASHEISQTCFDVETLQAGVRC